MNRALRAKPQRLGHPNQSIQHQGGGCWECWAAFFHRQFPHCTQPPIPHPNHFF